jgi:hypothetical protein
MVCSPAASKEPANVVSAWRSASGLPGYAKSVMLIDSFTRR